MDADFVIAAIAEGGMDAWAADLEIPARYGIFMPSATRSARAGSCARSATRRRSRASPATPQRSRPDAYIFNYTNPAPIEALAMRTAAPEVQSFGLCSCAAHAEQPEWLARAGGRHARAHRDAAGRRRHQPLRCRSRSCGCGRQDAMPLVRARATEPVVRWALETYGVLPYCWTHWTEFFPQMQRLEAPYAGTAQGVDDALRHHDARHGLRARARRGARGARARPWTAPDADPVTLADLPPGDEDEGIEVIDLIEAIVEQPQRSRAS